jgi:hypothetical protein
MDRVPVIYNIYPSVGRGLRGIVIINWNLQEIYGRVRQLPWWR